MDRQLRQLKQETLIGPFDIDLYRDYTKNLIRLGDKKEIFDWIQHIVPSSRLPNLPGLIIRTSKTNDPVMKLTSQFQYLSPDLTLHPLLYWDIDNPGSSVNHLRYDIVPNDPLGNFARSEAAEVNALQRALQDVTQIGDAYSLEEAILNNVLSNKASYSENDAPFRAWTALMSKAYAQSGRALQTKLHYEVFVPLLLEESYIHFLDITERTSLSNQGVPVAGHPIDESLRRQPFEGYRVRSKTHDVIPTQYFLFTNLLEATGRIKVRNFYNHIIEGDIDLRIVRDVAYDYLYLSKNEFQVRIPIGGYVTGYNGGYPNRFWLASTNYSPEGAERYFHVNWPRHWPINEGLVELAALAKLLNIPDPIEASQIENEVLKKVNRALPEIRAGYLVNYGEMYPESYNYAITGIEILEYYESHYSPGPALEFGLQVHNEQGLVLQLEQVKCDAVGVDNGFRWLQLVNSQFNLSDPKMWVEA